MTLQPTDRLAQALADRYRIERELGGGGMSRVFAAEETALNRRVAVKVLSAELGGGVSADRFRREVLTVAKLQHPHIVPLLNAGTAADAVYYTMPLVEGESLRARLAREGRFELREAVRLTREVCDALSYAHRHGVVHRDIKPDNVLLSGRHAVVTDFGVAKAISAAATDSTTLTAAGLAIGTPAYMAPEQVLAEPSVDHRVDHYALGCVLYEMLSGRPPFVGETTQAIMSAQVTRPPDQITKLRADVPPDVAAWLHRALAKAPDDRWPTTDQALDALDACLHRLTGELAAPRLLSRRALLWIGAAAIAVAAIVGTTVWRRAASGAGDGVDRIAIMPLVPTDAGDTALVRLGRDLVVTLTSNLDGIGDLHMIDPLSVLARTKDADAAEPDGMLGIARSIGARRALVGTLLRTGRQVRADYRLLPVDGGAAHTVGTATGGAGDDGIVVLTDSVTWKVLGAVLPEANRQVTSQTRSTVALRAYLDGENFMLANQWQPAEEAFARAIAADSTFWLAYRRVHQAADWMFSASRRAAEDSIAWEHRSSLPERERASLEADRVEALAEHLAAKRAITQRFPDYWAGWFQYGDDLLHTGTRLGISPTGAFEALDRALTLNPGLTPVLDHLVVFGVDSARAEEAYRVLPAVYGTAWDTLTNDFGTTARVFYGMRMDVLRSGHVAPALLDSMAIEILKERVPSSTIFSAGAPFFWTDPRGQVELSRVLARRAAPRRILDAADQYLAAAWAMRGAWDSALATIDRRYAASRTLPIAVERASLGTLAYWMGASGRDAAMSRREGLASLVNASPAGPAMSNASVALAFFDGLVAYIDRRGEGLDSARAALEGIPGVESSGILARELGAFRMELNGQRAAAADSLVRLEWERGGARTFLYFPTPFVRLAAGRWKGESGEAATADSLLLYYEIQTLGVDPLTNSRSTAGLAALERARAWDRAGDRTRAARYYRDFLRRYDMAPPEHRQYVTEAEAALARLVGGSDEPRERPR